MTSDEVRESTAIEAEQARPVSAAEPKQSRTERARNAAYRKRFVVLYVLLAVLAGAAIGAFVVLVAKPSDNPTVAWSSWVPTGSDDAKSKQVADHVAKRYRLPSGAQLVIALAGPPRVSAGGTTGDLPVRAIAVKPDTSTGQKEASDIDIVNTDTSLMYVLCGLGANCAIATGKPTVARHLLLQREALELSLYTFKYLPDVKTVTVFLPPKKNSTTSPTAVFFKRSDLKDALAKPLKATLSPRTPGVGEMKPLELARVTRVTRPRLYTYQYAQAQDGSAVLVLDPIVA